jgi:hypothetical protein
VIGKVLILKGFVGKMLIYKAFVVVGGGGVILVNVG